MIVRRTIVTVLVILLVACFSAMAFIPSVQNTQVSAMVGEKTVRQIPYASWTGCGILTLFEIALLLRFRTMTAGIVGMALDLLKFLLPRVSRYLLSEYFTRFVCGVFQFHYTDLPFASAITFLVALTLMLYALLIISIVRKKLPAPMENAVEETALH